jgi:UDP-arabinose 4-epimerase
LALLDKGYHVSIIDDLSRGSQQTVNKLQSLFPGKVSFHELDLGDAVRLKKLVKAVRPASVIHAAGIAYAGESVGDPLRYYDNNTVNTMHLAAAMEEAGTPLLVFSSSCATYGTPASNPVTEETPQQPVSPYGRSKLWAENVLRDWQRRVNGQPDVKKSLIPAIGKSPEAANEKQPVGVVFLRYFNVIGADPESRSGERYRPSMAEYKTNVRLSTAMFDAAQGLIPSFTVAGISYNTPDGTAVRDYVHVSDLANAHVAVMESMQRKGLEDLPMLRYYNVGTGRGVSVKEMVQATESVTGSKFNLLRGAKREGDVPQIYSDPTKIKREVGWSAKYTDLKTILGHQWKFRKTLTFSPEEEERRTRILGSHTSILDDGGQARMLAEFTEESEAVLGHAWRGDLSLIKAVLSGSKP